MPSWERGLVRVMMVCPLHKCRIGFTGLHPKVDRFDRFTHTPKGDVHLIGARGRREYYASTIHRSWLPV